MSFDDEIDHEKKKLEEERSGDMSRAKRAARLDTLRERIDRKVASKRLEFMLEDGEETDDEPSIVVVHADSGEELGAVFLDEDGFSFESEDDDYFADVDADTDAASFTEQLYQALKAGLPLFELDLDEDEDD